MFHAPDQQGFRAGVPPAQKTGNDGVVWRPPAARCLRFHKAGVPDERAAESLSVLPFDVRAGVRIGSRGELGLLRVPEHLKDLSIARVGDFLRTIAGPIGLMDTEG